MLTKSKLVWKLSAVVVAIVTVAIALTGYVHNLICAHYSLESSRAFLTFNSESIIQGIGQLMMSRNNERIEELIGEMSRDSTVYRDIRLVSHHSGRVFASRFGRTGGCLELEDRACAVCHDRDDLDGTDTGIVDELIDSAEGERVLSVVAPILNKPGCSNAACHVHTDGPPILGFLNADYSLRRMDAMAADRRTLSVFTVFASLLLGIVALWFMFERLLAKPIRGLIAGTKRITAQEFDFRFDQKRDDEIGVLEESFNTMTATIQAHQEELRSAKEYLEGIVENSADIIITVNPDGLIQTFHRGAEESLGYSREEVIGRRIEMLFADPRERDVAIRRLKDVDNVRNYETRFLAKDGRERNVLLTLSRLRDREGNPIGTFGISKDVTEEKRLLRELVQSQKFAAIGQAVTGIQHAIKNMLCVLTGGVYLIRNGTAKDDRQRIEEGTAMVQEGIERIDAFSRNMLNYAKEWKLGLQRTDLNDLVARICERNRQTAINQGVTLRSEVPPGLPPVLCDPELIYIAVTDILVNAIDACTWKEYRSGESPEVVLKNSLIDRGNYLVIEISDNGCGMDEEVKRNIFVPFFSTRKTLGTGLGLALTAKIINVHGGEVTVESEPDQGATFRVHLPVHGRKHDREAIHGQTSAHN
jgi:PAS domain S-box-containing protein